MVGDGCFSEAASVTSAFEASDSGPAVAGLEGAGVATATGFEGAIGTTGTTGFVGAFL